MTAAPPIALRLSQSSWCSRRGLPPRAAWAWARGRSGGACARPCAGDDDGRHLRRCQGEGSIENSGTHYLNSGAVGLKLALRPAESPAAQPRRDLAPGVRYYVLDSEDPVRGRGQVLAGLVGLGPVDPVASSALPVCAPWYRGAVRPAGRSRCRGGVAHEEAARQVERESRFFAPFMSMPAPALRQAQPRSPARAGRWGQK